MNLKVENLEFSYAGKTVLNGIDFELGTSEIMCVVGPNGCGKSTLLKCLVSILDPQKGSIMINGTDIKQIRGSRLAKILGYVPQNATQIFSSTVFDSVLLGRAPYTAWRSSDADIDIVTDILNFLNLDDIALSEFNQLSGGQRQRVFIARALAQQPQALILDEPTSALDIAHQLEVMDLLTHLSEDKGVSVIMVVHDLNLASSYADHVMMMKDGRVYAMGVVEEVLNRKNIASVYGVDAVVNHYRGKTSIIPISRVKTKQNNATPYRLSIA